MESRTETSRLGHHLVITTQDVKTRAASEPGNRTILTSGDPDRTEKERKGTSPGTGGNYVKSCDQRKNKATRRG
jgi:hypothetical protein